jgi:hypothetical protein
MKVQRAMHEVIAADSSGAAPIGRRLLAKILAHSPPAAAPQPALAYPSQISSACRAHWLSAAGCRQKGSSRIWQDSGLLFRCRRHTSRDTAIQSVAAATHPGRHVGPVNHAQTPKAPC